MRHNPQTIGQPHGSGLGGGGRLGVIAGVTRQELMALESCETYNGARVYIAQSWVRKPHNLTDARPS